MLLQDDLADFKHALKVLLAVAQFDNRATTLAAILHQLAAKFLASSALCRCSIASHPFSVCRQGQSACGTATARD